MSLLFLKSSKAPHYPKVKTLITQAFCDPAPSSSPAILLTLNLEEILFSAFLKLESQSPGGLVKTDGRVLPPRVCDSVSLGRGLGICISIKIPGDAAPAGLDCTVGIAAGL